MRSEQARRIDAATRRRQEAARRVANARMTMPRAYAAVEALSPDARTRVLANILVVLYGEGPDSQWDSSTIERVAEELDHVGLVPGAR